MEIPSIQKGAANQTIQELLDLYESKRLNLNPSYQQAATWTKSHKQIALYLLFRWGLTIMPNQAIVLRELNAEQGGDAPKQYELVNGKELITTILEFVGGQGLTIGSAYFYEQNAPDTSVPQERLMFEGKPLYDLSFAELPDELQTWFLSLKVYVVVLRGTNQQMQTQFFLLNQYRHTDTNIRC
jgi:hypothetical protein